MAFKQTAPHQHEHEHASGFDETAAPVRVSEDQAAWDAAHAEHANGEAAVLDHADDRRGLPAHDAPAHAVVDGDGVRVSRAFAMKNFLPDPDWINKNVVANGRGSHVIVGRVYGLATKAEPRTVDWQGKVIQSVALHGAFQAESRLTGEVRSVNLLFLPMAFASQVEAALRMEGSPSVEMDVDIGLEATGKPIPYEWTVTSYLEGRAERALRQLRGRRQIGQPARRALPSNGVAHRTIEASH